MLPKIELLVGLFQVRAIEPQITLLEKICLMHEEFTKPISAMRHLRMSRHLYDLSKLSDSIYADIAIQDDALFDRIVTHRKRYIRQTGIDYSNLDKQNLSFIPPSHIIEYYKTDYEKMKLNMIYGKAPAFEELISKLISMQAAIR